MQFQGSLLVVTDLERSRRFYSEVLDLDVVCDYGANVVLTGGVSLQTRESWLEFIKTGADRLCFGGNDAELYFEETGYDEFLQRLAKWSVELVHPPLEHRWGQRVVRFYDPDRHIIEVGEPLAAVCRRFQQGGLSVEGIARRMDIPEGEVERALEGAKHL